MRRGIVKHPQRCACGGSFRFEQYCGAWCCQECNNHRNLARCYCGWAMSGGDGREELLEMGERLEAEG
jgi:hypothetical protein